MPIHPPASSAATQPSCDTGKVKILQKILTNFKSSFKVPDAASPAKPAQAMKSANKRSSSKVDSKYLILQPRMDILSVSSMINSFISDLPVISRLSSSSSSSKEEQV